MPGARNQRILVIDDNPSIHADLRKILGPRPATAEHLEDVENVLFGSPRLPGTAKETYEIDSAYQGVEGVALLEKALAAGHRYVLAFVDMRMPPGQDGLQTVTQLWALDPDLHVIICTAHADFAWSAVLKQVGRTDKLVILKKPFENLEVTQLVCALTEKARLRAQLESQLTNLSGLVAQRTRDLQQTHDRLRKEAAERELAIEALQVSEARFAKAFSRSPLPMLIWRLKDDRFVDANARFQKLLGHDLGSVLHRETATVPLWYEPIERESLLADARAGAPIPPRGARLRTASGDTREVIISGDSFEMSGAAHALLILQDLTQGLRLEQQLRQAHKMEAVARLAGGVAHDFNNILTIVEGQVHLLKEPASAADSRESLQRISDVTERAARLTQHLLAFSRTREMRTTTIDLNQLFGRVRFLLAHLIGENIQWHCDLADALPCVEADEPGLEQVITQLVLNARDAMPSGGQVTVRTHAVHFEAPGGAGAGEARPGRFVCLSISDTGVGMDSETMVHLFEPFFTTKRIGEGAGLGLSTVYGIVRQHGGWVEVVSQAGVGSTFKVYLPVSDQINQSRQPWPEPLRLGKERATILLVEDEPMLREIVATVLSPLGYRVLEAGDAKEARRVWASEGGKIDLLLTDYQLPDEITGLELAEQFSAQKPGLRTLLSSGFEEVSAVEGSPQGCEFRFLSKPYPPAMLVRAVRESLAVEARKAA